MIITYIQGGLGNQMFQYAAGAALAARLKTDLLVDTTAFEREKFHQGFELGIFPNISIQHAGTKDLMKFPIHGGILDRIKSRIFRTSVYQEPHFHYSPDFARISLPCTYIKGYWQSEKYFLDFEENIRELFTFPEPDDSSNREILRLCHHSESVSIHVRRGDYVANPSANAIHGTCSIDYYLRSINAICKRLPHARFFVFSDDIEWTRNSIPLPGNPVYVDFNKGTASWRDMQLMSACKHHVIANSTFSWWAAWLNQNKEKIVHAPKQWFRTDKLHTSDLYARNWYIH